MPIIGNALQVGALPWFKFSAWRKTYGDILYLNMLGRPVIILNSAKAAGDLLERRSAIYSDRPRLIVASEMMTGGLFFPLTPYNETWRRMRKAAHEALNKGAAKDFMEYQTSEALLLARGMLQSSANWEKQMARATASMMMSCLYNESSISSEDDPRIRDVIDFVRRLGRASLPGAHWVEVIPWMRYIPSRVAAWKRSALDGRKKDGSMLLRLYTRVENNIATGDERGSFCATLIRDVDRHGMSAEESSWLAGTIFAAGSDSTTATMAWWALAMLTYPDIQKRAQEEIDSVVGRTRLPTFADLSHLPYVRAIVQETLRWRPVGPIGIPHRSVQDDTYEGYFIPKGSIVITNLWELNRDTEFFGPDPDRFNPARYLDEKGCLISGLVEAKDDAHFSFGFGRRGCVGKHVAVNTLSIEIMTCLWALSLAKVKGRDLDLDSYVDDGLIVRPKHFQVNVQPRFPEALALLSQECELRGL
ncbi:cytochrome P450 [Peniophora sp. CONT]|nr:cytochrome P450 [Peniophora sp. CONT]